MSINGKTVSLSQLASVIGIAIAVAGSLAGAILWAENRYVSQANAATQSADIRHDAAVATKASEAKLDSQLGIMSETLKRLEGKADEAAIKLGDVWTRQAVLESQQHQLVEDVKSLKK
ncbi:MAG: hypothetical protein UY96_C0013G0009 [Parcubacteria group bacterium GW2011_GWB1_56_8]|nr:MAG: hypothetical protein UY96_C0013G0009 [Parcubacteria group bacterium GW2011_GWB1_56_8]